MIWCAATQIECNTIPTETPLLRATVAPKRVPRCMDGIAKRQVYRRTDICAPVTKDVGGFVSSHKTNLQYIIYYFCNINECNTMDQYQLVATKNDDHSNEDNETVKASNVTAEGVVNARRREVRVIECVFYNQNFRYLQEDCFEVLKT